MKGIVWDDESRGVRFEYVEIPPELLETAQHWREKMIEAAAEASEELLEQYLSGESLSEAQIKAGLRKRTVANEIVPMLCGSAFKNKGVQSMLDAVIDYLPSPVDVPAIPAHRGRPGGGAPSERRRAVLRARLQDHDRSLRRPVDLLPRLLGRGQLGRYRLQPAGQARAHRAHPADARQRAQRDQEVRAGDIAAAVGLKEATTGDTLCDPHKIIILERMSFPIR